MQPEVQLARFINNLRFEDLPPQALKTVKKVVLTVCGTAVGGARTDGIKELNDFFAELDGKPEATVLFYNTKLPAHEAALVNAAMARALDYCDSINPGPHFGASLISIGFALAELMGGVSGKEFLTAFAIGQETGSRFNLPEEAYGGVDPTGVAGAFAATAMACRLLKLTEAQMLNALGIALNNASGSFQSHIDGTLSVRLNQGMLAHDGILAARLAQRGLTGPRNFLSGVYGYCNLQGRGMIDTDYIVSGLGEQWKLEKTVFKKYPSCFMTATGTEAALQLIDEYGFNPEDVKEIEIRMQPFGYNLVGGPFKVGDNPKVDAQFNITYCIANAFLRKKSCLAYFEPDYIKDTAIAEFAKKIRTVSDEEIYRRGHAALEMIVTGNDGKTYVKRLDEAPGTPAWPLNDEDHARHWEDCVAFGNMPHITAQAQDIAHVAHNLENEKNALLLMHMLNAAPMIAGQTTSGSVKACCCG